MRFDDRLAGRRRKPGSAHVLAALALFVALGGTAAATVTLERDSVGPVQIRADAVRSPEIESGAVRSAEIADDTIRVGDLALEARTALETKARDAEKPFAAAAVCPGTDLTPCPPLIQRELAPGDWLIQAKLAASTPDGTGNDFNNRCGLVLASGASAPTVLDEVRIGRLGDIEDSKPIALLAVVRDAVDTSIVSIRCTLAEFEEVELDDLKLAALELGRVIGG
jgi:hypothetical protein